MAVHSDMQRRSRAARSSPDGSHLRSAAITTAVLLTAALTVVLTAVLAGTVGAGTALAGAIPHPSAGRVGPGRPAPAGSRLRSVNMPSHPVAGTAGDPISGNDISARQGAVDWSQVAAQGGQFAYIKATQSTYWTNPDFAQQYGAAYNAGLIRGAYHFAIPSYSSGAAQADYFVSNGGGWSPGTRTLPGALDIEYNPHGRDWCYGLSQSAMVSWIGSFVDEYHARTGRWPVIYTATDWWSACTGNYGGFAANDPLWIARYSLSAGTLPAGWSSYTFWQYADSGTFPGDQDMFNGPSGLLLSLANGR